MNAVQKGRSERLHIADMLITALEADSMAGGEKRCGDQRATSAFITVAKPGDKKPYLDLLIFGHASVRLWARDGRISVRGISRQRYIVAHNGRRDRNATRLNLL